MDGFTDFFFMYLLNINLKKGFTLIKYKETKLLLLELYRCQHYGEQIDNLKIDDPHGSITLTFDPEK